MAEGTEDAHLGLTRLGLDAEGRVRHQGLTHKASAEQTIWSSRWDGGLGLSAGSQAPAAGSWS